MNINGFVSTMWQKAKQKGGQKYLESQNPMCGTGNCQNRQSAVHSPQSAVGKNILFKKYFLFNFLRLTGKNLGHYQELQVYQKAFSLAGEIFHLTKYFPSDEKYSLISQIRRSSRSVCSNIAEGYRKRRYPAHFISKLKDADMENTETEVWIDFAESCDYINAAQRNKLKVQVQEIGKLLNFMIQNPKKFQ